MGVEIRNAINAGKEVTFHEHPIHAHGWTGYGYSIIDPDTGAGAYIIEGGGNGGFITGLIYGGILATTIFVLAASIGTVKLATGPVIAALALELASISIIYQLYKLLYGQETTGCFLTGVAVGMATTQAFINIIGLDKILKGLPKKLADLLILIMTVGLLTGSSEPLLDCT